MTKTMTIDGTKLIVADDDDEVADNDRTLIVSPTMKCRECQRPLRRRLGGDVWRCPKQCQRGQSRQYTIGWLERLGRLGCLADKANR